LTRFNSSTAREFADVGAGRPAPTTVIVRLDRRTGIPEAAAIKPRSLDVLDSPLEPVIGLAEGETRWRRMTTRKRRALFARE
jgi:hypothetical protein